MTWLGIILWFLMHTPDIIELVKKFIDLIHGFPHQQSEGLRSQLTDLIRSNDVQGAKDVVLKTCNGVGCPVDLVRE